MRARPVEVSVPGDPTPLRVVAPKHRVLAGVEEGILRRGPRPGDAAPTVPELTGTLGVSRRSASDALDVLAAAGILAGGAPPSLSPTPVGGIGRLLRLLLRDAVTDSAGELLALRLELERAAAAGAARAASSRDLVELGGLVGRMRDPALSPTAFGNLDAAFHIRIAGASGNVLHEQLMIGLRDAVTGQMGRSFRTVRNAAWRSTVTSLCDEHERLLKAIGARRPEDAASQVAAHVHNFHTR